MPRMRQAKALGVSLDAVVIPCGGGGLSSGISVAVKDASPGTAVWAVEPEHFDDTRRSLAAGARVSNEPGYSSICDAILTAEPGAITFEINRKNLAGAIAVSDKATAQAMRDAMVDDGLVAEPLDQAVNVDGVHFAVPARSTSTIWPGCSGPASPSGRASTR